MTEMMLSAVWTEETLVKQVQRLANRDYSWSKLRKDNNPLDKLKKAAVLVPLFIRDNEIYVWLTLRSQHLRKDPGDVAFPGGKRDGEEDEIQTCLREAHEEIGLSPADVHIVAPVPPRQSRHQILVSPIIGLVNPSFVPEINTSEVDVAFCLPLRRFLSTDGHRSVRHEHQGRLYNLSFFDDSVDGRVITTYGLTATLCIEVAMGIFERNPEFGVIADMLDKFKTDPKDPFAYQVQFLEEYAMQLSSKL